MLALPASLQVLTSGGTTGSPVEAEPQRHVVPRQSLNAVDLRIFMRIAGSKDPGHEPVSPKFKNHGDLLPDGGKTEFGQYFQKVP